MNSVIPAVIRQIPSLPNPPTDFVRDVISYGYFGDVSRYINFLNYEKKYDFHHKMNEYNSSHLTFTLIFLTFKAEIRWNVWRNTRHHCK